MFVIFSLLNQKKIMNTFYFSHKSGGKKKKQEKIPPMNPLGFLKI